MKIQYLGKALQLSSIPELTAAHSTAFRDNARAALKDGLITLDIDLSGTRMIDSSGLGALISLQKTMTARGGNVRILRPTPTVQQILELTRLHRVFEIVSP
jgi:anti-sigma B factor antagonist